MIVLFFADYWDEMWRRRQQIAWRLAQMDDVDHVYYIERPLPLTSLVKYVLGRSDRDGKDRWRRLFSRKSCAMPQGSKLTVLTTFSLFPSSGTVWMFRLSEMFREWWVLHWIRNHIKLKEEPLVWVSHAQMTVDTIKKIGRCFLWYDCTEDFSALPGIKSYVRAQIQQSERWFSENARVVSCVSSILYEEKKMVNSKVCRIPNAVDLDLFHKLQVNFVVPDELKNVSRPVLAFVGFLGEDAHDWELILEVAKRCPDWLIVLVGGLSLTEKTLSWVRSCPNIICVGQKPYESIPAYLKAANVCFQFYKPIRKNDSGNSQKLFLYFAMGRPVVSTPSADVQNYQEVVYLVRTADDFVDAVRKALAETDPGLQERRRAIAGENTWDRHVEKIREILRAETLAEAGRGGHGS